MAQLFFAILKTARPRQWIKNLSLFAPLVFSGFLFWPGYLSKAITGFILFSLLASSLYILNDIIDYPNDRKHPFKKKRPIASGELPISLAIFITIFGLFVTLTLSWTISYFFFFALFAYTSLQIFYSFWLKHIPIFDVLSIATSFVIRVYAGSFIVNLHMSVWFLLTVISASLFLAVGKRQSERTLLKGTGVKLEGPRTTLTHYSQRLLDIYTGMFANTTWLTYALFTFQQQFVKTRGFIPTLFASLPKTLITQKWLMLTVPVVIYGVMRYLQLVYEQNQGESPERVLLSDKPILITTTIWGIMVLGIIYVIG